MLCVGMNAFAQDAGKINKDLLFDKTWELDESKDNKDVIQTYKFMMFRDYGIFKGIGAFEGTWSWKDESKAVMWLFGYMGIKGTLSFKSISEKEMSFVIGEYTYYYKLVTDPKKMKK